MRYGDAMTTSDENYEDEYSEYDAFEDEDDEGGLSGFYVLIIGLVMLGAFAATTYVFYKQGIKDGERRAGIETPYVAADPEPIKIETADSENAVEEREVYDVFDGEEADTVTVISEGPEEPVDRVSDDAIGELAAETAQEAGDRVASLVEEDAVALSDPVETAPDTVAATEPAPASVSPDRQTIVSASQGALSGTHIVQVGAFRSNDEAVAHWNRMRTRIGDVLGDKEFHIEEADLGDNGIYHRLRVGPFSSSTDANEYCATLKENGQDCLPKGI